MEITAVAHRDSRGDQLNMNANNPRFKQDYGYKWKKKSTSGYQFVTHFHTKAQPYFSAHLWPTPLSTALCRWTYTVRRRMKGDRETDKQADRLASWAGHRLIWSPQHSMVYLNSWGQMTSTRASVTTMSGATQHPATVWLKPAPSQVSYYLAFVLILMQRLCYLPLGQGNESQCHFRDGLCRIAVIWSKPLWPRVSLSPWPTLPPLSLAALPSPASPSPSPSLSVLFSNWIYWGPGGLPF